MIDYLVNDSKLSEGEHQPLHWGMELKLRRSPKLYRPQPSISYPIVSVTHAHHNYTLSVGIRFDVFPFEGMLPQCSRHFYMALSCKRKCKKIHHSQQDGMTPMYASSFQVSTGSLTSKKFPISLVHLPLYLNHMVFISNCQKHTSAKQKLFLICKGSVGFGTEKNNFLSENKMQPSCGFMQRLY